MAVDERRAYDELMSKRATNAKSRNVLLAVAAIVAGLAYFASGPAGIDASLAVK